MAKKAVASFKKADGRILSVLGRDVAGCPWHTTLLVLSALEDDLYSVSFSFLCHDLPTTLL